jgi:Gpi18-like mannosyltransferase
VNRRLIALLGIGLAARLALLPVGGYDYDLTLMQSWAERLVTRPLVRFYASPEVVDHLPGDLWLLWLLAQAVDLVTPGSLVPSIALKLVPTLADVGIGVLVFLLGRRLAGPDAGLLGAGLYVLNPASIFLTAIWGQWDSVSAAFALIAVWLVIRGDPAWALPLLTWAALIKPPFAALLPLVLLAFVRRHVVPWTRWGGTHPRTESLAASLGELALTAVISVLLAGALLLPFDVGVGALPARWDLLERVRYSLELYPEASVNAFNLWATPLGGNRESDAQPLLGVAVRTWGLALFGAAYVLILARYWRRPDAQAYIWAAFAIAFAAYMLPTRVHERYLLPALTLAALAAALATRLRWFFAALSVSYFANLYWVYDQRERALELEVLYQSEAVVVLVALVNVGLLAYTLTRMLPVLLESNAGTIPNESPPNP